ncbi:flagellar filament capping protein FliD [Neobacillus niacini]|uniref:flagellar filament capping protein FliD n=1 Tax=Neobacillus niacini TaxID=86668 RepID=UPI00285EAB21|nr:flagellar filament capping protein FliD [Neobacillus niacini]MDR7001001.1 flagellar hook-associated protein 2 [Neobacillus niacini]
MTSVNLTTHVSGLASGMDTEKIVSDMMKVNRIPLDKLNQAKTINSWKTDAYREINTKIASFRDAMQDLRLEGTFSNSQKVTSSDPSIDVSMNGTSTLMNFTISNATLYEPSIPASVSFGANMGKGSDAINKGNASIAFTLNGKNFNTTIDNNTTYNQVIDQINSFCKDNKLNVIANNVGGSLVFTNTIGGVNPIKITGTSQNALDIFNIQDGQTDTGFPLGINYYNGNDARDGSVTINNTVIKITSNTFTYDGVRINLKQNIASNVSINVTADTDKVFDKIKTFVDQYNNLIKDLNDKISETKNRDYPPLTDDQKKDMKDADITLWENKAKSGLLANDPTIRQFLTQVRTSMSEAIQGTGINASFNTLQDIGITTSSNYKDNGKLTLDETKLKAALTSNLSDVQKLFATKFDTGNASDTTVTSSEKYKNSGFGVRIYDRIADTLSQLKVIAGAPGTVSINSNLAKEVTSLNDRIAKTQDRLSTQEQSLWAKFNAMESALQKLNSQSSWLTQQLGQ